jgi:hypothetical protein
MEYLEDNLDEWLGEQLQVGAAGGLWRGAARPPLPAGRTRAPPRSTPRRLPLPPPHATPTPPTPSPPSSARAQSYGDEDYLVFDCPGQIELYNHVDVFRSFVRFLRREGWSPLVVYCLDSHFMTDAAKFIAGSLQALAAMVKLELPHINVLTKMDLLEDRVGGWAGGAWGLGPGAWGLGPGAWGLALLLLLLQGAGWPGAGAQVHRGASSSFASLRHPRQAAHRPCPLPLTPPPPAARPGGLPAP